MSRAAALAVAALACATAASAAAATPHRSDEPEPIVVAIDDRVSVTVPADMAREQRSLGARGDMLTLAEGGDVMVVTVYRRGIQAAPIAAEALAVHADELEHALGPAIRHSLERRVLGRAQKGIGLTLQRGGVERDAWVVAFEAHGRTVVASAVIVRGSPNGAAMDAVLKGIRVQ